MRVFPDTRPVQRAVTGMGHGAWSVRLSPARPEQRRRSGECHGAGAESASISRVRASWITASIPSPFWRVCAVMRLTRSVTGGAFFVARRMKNTE